MQTKLHFDWSVKGQDKVICIVTRDMFKPGITANPESSDTFLVVAEHGKVSIKPLPNTNNKYLLTDIVFSVGLTY